jgi:hypothetical protein
MNEAIAYLAVAKELHDELEAIYVSAMDFSKVEKIQNKIAEEIREFASVNSQ